MRAKLPKFFGLVMFFLFFFTFLPAYSQGDLWEVTQEKFYFGPYVYRLSPEGKVDFSPPSSFKSDIIDTSFLGKSYLTVRGRKTIQIKYTYFHYLDPQTQEQKEKSTSTTDIEQKLQLKVKGKIGDRISVNVDYDDTAPRTEQQKIHVTYKGGKDDIIQEVALGDLRLAIPRTEFVSHSESVFGARVKAKSGDFHLMGIGSVTKGVYETKTFTGKTTSEEKNISDTGYFKKKYFKLYFDQDYPPDKFGNPSFSYTSGSAEIWIDDQDRASDISGFTVEMTVEPISGDIAYTGWFDRQYLGQDYSVNYKEGVINFYKSIGDQFVIAVRYKDNNGNYRPDPGTGYTYHMIRKGPDPLYDVYGINNRYYLGSQKINQDDFIFKIKDLSGNVVYDWATRDTEPSSYEVRIDFDFGIARVINPTSSGTYYRPFPDAYPPTFYHRYTLYTAYSHAIDAYFLRPDVVLGSERIYLDGKLLVRDEDYIIDYASGFLSFVDPGRITSTTEIRVEYEYSPFFGGQATLLGARLEFIPSEKFLGLSNFYLGSTFLSQSAPRAAEVPKVDSSPISQEVMEIDTHFSLHANLGDRFPIDISFSAEVAQSTFNPNTFGKAMLEDFASARVEDEVPLNEDSWQLSSNPGQEPSKRDEIQISDTEIKGDKVNPIWSEDEIRILDLAYDFTSASWDSVVCSLSPVGKDYTDMKYLEIWIKEIPSEATVHFDLGLVNEDTNGNGELDTEDKNGDGVLNPGEDTNGNGELDTEDLNGNGVLDTDENYSTYNLSDYVPEKPDPAAEWCKYTIPLNDAGNWDLVKYLIKHVRIWITGYGKDTVMLAKISASGNLWEKKDVDVRGVNNYDDIDFPDPLEESSEFRSYYREMYGTIQTSEGKYRKVSAISISGETGYIQETFLAPKDLSDYRQINLWLYREYGDGEFYLRFGSDADVNYYEYSYPLSSQSTKAWVNIQIPFPDLTSEGNPIFNDINQVRLGIRGLAAHIYIDDIYLSDVYGKEGRAQRYSAKANFSKYLSLTGDHRKVDSSFNIIGASPTNQELEIKRWGAELNLISSLPVFYENLEKSTRNMIVEKTTLEEVAQTSLLEKSEVYKAEFNFISFLPISYRNLEKYTVKETTLEGATKTHRSEKSEVYKAELNLISFLPIAYQLSKESIHSITEETTYQEDKELKETKSYKIGFRLPSYPKLLFEGFNSLARYPIRDNPERITKDSHKLSLDYKIPIKFFILPTDISSSYQLITTKTEVESKPLIQEITKKGSITLPFRPAQNFNFDVSFSQIDTNQEEEGEEKPKYRGRSLSVHSRLSLFRLSPKMEYKGTCIEDNFSSTAPFERKVSANSKFSLSLPFRWKTFFKDPKILESLSYYSSYTIEKQLIYENTTTTFDFFSQVGLKDIHIKDGNDKLNLKKRSFSLRQTWKPFNFLSTNLEYGNVENDEVKEGAPLFVTVKSWPVGSFSFDLNSTPLIDGVSRSLFSSSHLLLKYTKKETVKRDISTVITQQPSIAWKIAFKKPKSLSSTFTYESTRGEEKLYGEVGKIHSFSSNYGLKFDYYAYLPWGVKIPLISQIVNFKNEIHLSASLSRELKQKEVALKKSEDKETWKLAIHIAYKMMENINMKLGLEGSYFKDRVEVGEDYYSLGGSIYVEIKF